MLPRHADDVQYSRVATQDDVAADQRHRAEPGSALAQVVAWGALAECLTSVFCPIVMVGALDVSATILNISGAFLAGIAHSADATPSAPRLHSACATFQAGFIGVFTSFTVLFEQAARLDTSPGCENRACGAGYVLAVFAAQLAAAAAAARLGARLCGRLKEMPPPTSQSQVRALRGVVIAACVWVALAPPGAVADPLQIDAPRRARERRTKRGDAALLGAGLLLQAAGLWLSRRLSGKERPGPGGRLVLWGPLRCNLVATLLLLALRAGRCDGTAATATDAGGACPPLLAGLVAKLCSSACGAISVSGGLAPALWGLWSSGARRSRRAVLLNLSLHVGLALLAGVLLPQQPHFEGG